MKKPTSKPSKPIANPNKEFIDKLTKDFGIPKYEKPKQSDGYNDNDKTKQK